MGSQSVGLIATVDWAESSKPSLSSDDFGIVATAGVRL